MVTQGEISPSALLPLEQANEIVVEHRGWAESIARSVARAWNLDWQSDGLDGAAMEALIFCSRRYDPTRGVAFKSYARKRIHEASAEAARKSKGWRSSPKAIQQAREISVELLNIFPELRNGHLPGEDGDSQRGAIRQLLVGASLVAAKEGISAADPEQTMDYKRLIVLMTRLEPLHQELLWKIYWEGLSLRNLAEDWGTDELNVIREHKALLAYLFKGYSTGRVVGSPKVRPGLKTVAIKFKREKSVGAFKELLGGNSRSSEREEGVKR